MIGTTLEAAGLPRVKVVGQRGTAWVVEALDSFAAPYLLTAEEAAAYAAPSAVDEARAWSKLGLGRDG